MNPVFFYVFCGTITICSHGCGNIANWMTASISVSNTTFLCCFKNVPRKFSGQRFGPIGLKYTIPLAVSCARLSWLYHINFEDSVVESSLGCAMTSKINLAQSVGERSDTSFHFL